MDRDTYEAQQRARLEVGAKLAGDDARAERFERLVQQAEVSMDRLTGSPEWDGFVQIVQSRLEAAKTDYENMAYELAHPSFPTGIRAMTRRRIELAQLRAVLDTLEWITALPREIMDAAAATGIGEDEPGQLSGPGIIRAPSAT